MFGTEQAMCYLEVFCHCMIIFPTCFFLSETNMDSLLSPDQRPFKHLWITDDFDTFLRKFRALG